MAARDGTVPAVLVTGFLDWPRDGRPPQGFNRWSCCHNPSGRLLLEHPHEAPSPPTPGTGPLCHALRSAADIDWRFALLPVAWGIADTLDLGDIDVVIGLGLGVYDHPHRVQLERGALNRRCDLSDVDGHSPGRDSLIATDAADMLPATPTQCRRIDAALEACDQNGPWWMLATDAGPTNAYICNETHFLYCRNLGLRPVPGYGFFIHLPPVSGHEELAQLAGFLTAPIMRLALG